MSKRIEAAKNAYVFYHIPEVDDPYYAQLQAKDDQKRKDWEKVVAAEQVKGLFAGHFHD